VVEVFGYHNEEGNFVELEPLRIPRAQFDIIEASHIDTSELIAQLISELYIRLMDAELREIVVAQVPELLECLGEACCQAVEEHANRRMAADEAFGIAKAYTQACRVAAGTMDTA